MLVVFVVLSVIFISVDARMGEQGPISALKNGYAVITKPLVMLGSVASTPVQSADEAISNTTASNATLSGLKEENAQLKNQISQSEEYKSEATRLEALLELKNTYGLESVGAQVIGGSNDSWIDTITIGKGSNDGIEVDMPVANVDGIIGQVTNVTSTSATVRLVTDENFSVSTMIQSTRATGILSGSIDGTLYLEYVSVDENVVPGDFIITSGLGGVYPKGLLLGTVTTVDKQESSVYYDIVVTPVSKATNNEEVLVITSNSVTLPEQDDASSSVQETDEPSSQNVDITVNER